MAETDPPGAAPGKTLTPAARRALEEAAERRAKAKPLELPPELGGQAGPEPTRYGDWEKNGIASDFCEHATRLSGALARSRVGRSVVVNAG